ncbi:MFS general substrate transporter [Metschnikowia bicuspidata var. bicuspidata NRRL YB-4993]|uniref:MFS general substrate transporter n=1 Tax=Metschnikowia bicuspidata var. bicuspidata NRRL YB-4993 TaxID=869754 RepID=A0A1A0HFI0_9ASCO|nr:MFS general substrate transporter [Metschnikowia bicuspidata var. bicuspidata NRRL YB-4993]OBA22756.1 MFS general substrate transporter [Metschnikowia bicuspidata var. bicuspidata NRRL YB-4993]
MASRDLPHSFLEALFGWAKKIPEETSFHPEQEIDENGEVKRVQAKNLWPAFVSGAGLFSDGYVNNSISTVTTCLAITYGDQYTESNAISNISAIAFAGTVIGQLTFGYISDHVARKGGMLIANLLLIFFTLLCAVATWGKTPEGLFAALTTFRFFLGIAIGAEYPTSSVIASEFANQLPPGHRNRYFCWFTNFTIDAGFVVSAFVPLVLLWIFSEDHLSPVWRLTVALGVFPPLALFFMRRKMKNSDSYEKLNMKSVKKFPFWLVFKFYWFRLAVVSTIWFVYDFSVYSFGLYSSFILTQILPGDDIYKAWGWNVVFNLFYIPGSFLGGFSTDFLGPRLTLFIGLACQGVIGMGMTAGYAHLKNHIGAFVVVYGIFITLGEFGAGNNVGVLASKTSATPIRGQYYGIAAAIGKVGAFVGTYIFPIIIKNNGGYDSDRGITTAFYISSGLSFFSAFLALFLCPSIGQDSIDKEDKAFVEYLRANDYDISQMGNGEVVQDYESHLSEDEKAKSVNVQESSI